MNIRCISEHFICADNIIIIIKSYAKRSDINE